MKKIFIMVALVLCVGCSTMSEKDRGMVKDVADTIVIIDSVVNDG